MTSAIFIHIIKSTQKNGKLFQNSQGQVVIIRKKAVIIPRPFTCSYDMSSNLPQGIMCHMMGFI